MNYCLKLPLPNLNFNQKMSSRGNSSTVLSTINKNKLYVYLDAKFESVIKD